jgi:hypothetical protein
MEKALALGEAFQKFSPEWIVQVTCGGIVDGEIFSLHDVAVP